MTTPKTTPKKAAVKKKTAPPIPMKAAEKKRRFALPDQPSWKVFFALFGMFFVVTVGAALTLRNMRQEITDLEVSSGKFREAVVQGAEILGTMEDGLDSLIANAEVARQRGFATRAQNCMTIVLDNDRNFELTAACEAPEIASYYPPALCRAYFPGMVECSSKAHEPAI